MASATMMNALKQLATKEVNQIKAGVTRVASRSLHTSRPVYMGGANAPDYVHAPKMYTIKKMKNRKLKFGAMIGGAACLGFGIPFWAVKFTQSKTGA